MKKIVYRWWGPTLEGDNGPSEGYATSDRIQSMPAGARLMPDTGIEVEAAQLDAQGYYFPLGARRSYDRQVRRE